ncbi:hypothetical protein [uncultured Tateyamaria sp.]|uniref:hypothetical protein n=1 Tax=uncultured Tateyamaria sp. TaxID=455651 RepID=UPI0026355C59|nr:hypothetical protein [uncultured Tateyamaria sp.]
MTRLIDWTPKNLGIESKVRDDRHEVIESLGYSSETHFWVEAGELSRATLHIVFIQINARGAAGQVLNGNSITMETFTTAFTAAAPVFYAVNGDPFAKQQADRAERLSNLGRAGDYTPPTQLGLFDSPCR